MLTPTPNAAFIVSAGRSGSSLLSRLVRAHSTAASISEFFATAGGAQALAMDEADGAWLWSHITTPSEDLWGILTSGQVPREVLWQEHGAKRAEAWPIRLITLPHLDLVSPDVLRDLRVFVGGLPRQSVGSLYAHLFAWLAQRADRRGWVERSGGSLEYLDKLVRHWPVARFVFLHRTGSECALSMAQHSYFRVRVSRMALRDQTSDVRRLLSRELPLDRFGAYWSAVTCRAVAILARLPREQVLDVSYDHLLSRPVDTLRRVLVFLEGEAAVTRDLSSAVSQIRSPASRPTSTLTDTHRRALERACSPGTRALAERSLEAGSTAIG